MLPPQSATTYQCTKCSWSKTVKANSDVRTEGFDIFSQCPKCQSAVSAFTPPPSNNSLLSILKRILISK